MFRSPVFSLEKTPMSKTNKARKNTNDKSETNHKCSISNKTEIWDDLDEIRRDVCVAPDEYGFETHSDGSQYCLFHLPKSEKNKEKFNEIFSKRIQDYCKYDSEDSNKRKKCDFRYVWFPSSINLRNKTFFSEVLFGSAIFSNSVDFSQTVFLEEANFYKTNFSSQTDFRSAIFIKQVSFANTIFCGLTGFDYVTFSDIAVFFGAKFKESSQTVFYASCFKKFANFGFITVKGYLYFEAGKGDFFDGDWQKEKEMAPKRIFRKTSVFEHKLVFEDVIAEKPDHISFRKVRLCPSWFVNTDSRKIIFADIIWENQRAKKSDIKKELIHLTRRKYERTHNYKLLISSFLNLSANAEEFYRLKEASKFRRSAFECEKLERRNKRRLWRRDLKKRWYKKKSLIGFIKEIPNSATNFPTDFIHFFYRWSSSYGESWFRALCWLIVIWLGFGFLYYRFGEFGINERKILDELHQAISYSLLVMTLQRPEPRPLSTVTQVLYGVETILSPLQATLLALAIRRKFMR